MNEAVCCMFTDLSLSSGLRNLYIISSLVFHNVFFCQLHIPIIMYCSRLFVVVFQEIRTFKHDVCRATELHLSTKFHVCQCSGTQVEPEQEEEEF